ncbi:ABC transporter permease [Streptomyces sp. DSM 40907]|uniref:ABC transporter permease n=1 Tax=Streptomyces kutzneri TaxID=3051179 RepID=UPI0028D246D7|nr:FtsX-like permease family protein [Streptomyces sp. DSM 40907]
MFLLAMRTLRFRRGSFIASFLAMFLGSVLLMSWGGLFESGLRNVVPPERLAAAPVVVAGEQAYTLSDGSTEVKLPERVPVDRSLADAIGKLPGVRQAVADVSLPAGLIKGNDAVKGDVPTVGHGWSSAALAPYTLTEGTGAEKAGEVVLDRQLAQRAGFRVGDQAKITVAGTDRTYKIVGLAQNKGVTSQQALFLADSEITGLLPRKDKASVIAVLPKPGVSAGDLAKQVATVATEHKALVLTGDDRGQAEFPEAQRFTMNLQIVSVVFGGMVTAVALFGVASPLALAVQQRHREMALLRASGAVPRQLRRMILSETFVLSIVATALAVLPSPALSRWIMDRLVDGQVASAQMTFHLGWVSIAATAALALGTALGAAAIASRRATQVRATEALADADVQRRPLGKARIFFALLCFLGSASTGVLTVTVMQGPMAGSTAGSSTTLFVMGLALLGPRIAQGLLAVLSLPMRLFGLSGTLAALNTRARAARVAAVITPVMLLTGIACADLYMGTTEVTMAKERYSETMHADAALIAPPGGFGPGTLDQVRKLNGVGAASEFVSSIGYVDSPKDSKQTKDGWPVQGITATGSAGTAPVTPTAGSLENLRGNSVALAEAHAKSLGRGVGDEITMRLGDGTQATFKVVALFAAKDGFESILLPADLLAQHTNTGKPTRIMVKAQPGVSVGEVTASLAAFAATQPGSQAADRDVLTESYASAFNTEVLANYLVVVVVIGFGALAVVNSLVTSTVRRTREFGLQRLAGSTRKQVLRMVGMEAAVVAFAGLLLGTIGAIVGLLPFLISRFDLVVPRGSIGVYLGIVGFVALLTFTATIVPTRRALRIRAVQAAGQMQ